MSNRIPIQDEKARRQRRLLILRNWLNGVFMLLALIAIIGVLLFKTGDIRLKMVEAIFRMPGIFNKL